jgi:hypothetical protein
MSPPKTIDLDGEPEETPGPQAESFETARPVTPPAGNAKKRKAPEPEQPKALQSTEHYLLGCFLLDEGATLDKAIAAGLIPTDFTERTHIAVFSALRQMRREQTPIALDTLVEFLGPRINDAGGIQTLMALDQAGTTARADHALRQVIDAAERRRLDRLGAQIQEAAKRGDSPEDIQALIASARPREIAEAARPRPITSFAYPSDDDPNMLLGSEDYLGRGGGLLFVSHAGAGKSSWAMDACMMWALGRAWMQIKSHQPRKILIIQAEDSDRYIGKIFSSFAHVNRLSADDLALLSKNCVIVRLKGVSGEAFFTELARYTQQHQPDLVVINPIYLYAEGDITRSEFAQPFLLGLDRANREEKWAYILIHHTGKPQAKGKDGQRAEVEDWESAYMGFGSSYLANWPRCTILLEPVAGQAGSFQIKLGKGGYNAGVTKMVEQGAGTREEPVTRIAVRHSRDKMDVNGRERAVYYWELDDSTPVAPRQPLGAGKKRKYPYEEFEGIFPLGQEKAEGFRSLHRKARVIRDTIGSSTFEDMVFDAIERGVLVRDLSIPQQPKYYRPLPPQPSLV